MEANDQRRLSKALVGHLDGRSCMGDLDGTVEDGRCVYWVLAPILHILMMLQLRYSVHVMTPAC